MSKDPVFTRDELGWDGKVGRSNGRIKEPMSSWSEDQIKKSHPSKLGKWSEAQRGPGTPIPITTVKSPLVEDLIKCLDALDFVWRGEKRKVLGTMFFKSIKTTPR